jgi:DNA (cytosine-5)-methyltransferase 1
MSLGFEQAGFDVVAALEFDRAHAAVHAFNFPRCEVIEEDAADVTGERLRAAVTAGVRRHGRDEADVLVDVVFGGPPCQGFSVGGLLNPNDPRNRLVEQFVRLVLELKPRAFVLENVPAMASRALPGEQSPVPEWLAGRMERAGYVVGSPMTLNASRFGVPQDRRRLLIVGTTRPYSAPTEPAARVAVQPKAPERGLRRGEVGHDDTDLTLPPGPTVRDALSGLPDLDEFPALLRCDAIVLEEQHRRAVRDAASEYARALVEGRADCDDLSWPRRRSPSVLTSSLRTVHAHSVSTRLSKTKPGGREPISRFVRLHAEGISPTLRAGSTPDRGSFSAPRPIHPTLPRVISVREAARIQGFPDWFRFSAAKWHGFRQVGNSVCPPVARAVAETVREALELPAIRPTERLELGRPSLLRVASGAGRSAAKARFDQEAQGAGVQVSGEDEGHRRMDEPTEKTSTRLAA